MRTLLLGIMLWGAWQIANAQDFAYQVAVQAHDIEEYAFSAFSQMPWWGWAISTLALVFICQRKIDS